MTVRLKSGEVVAWSPVDDGPVQQDVPEDGGLISAQISLSTPGSMVTEAMTMTYDPAEPRGKGGEWVTGAPGQFMYHRTPARNQESILKTGLNPSRVYAWFPGAPDKGTYLTADDHVFHARREWGQPGSPAWKEHVGTMLKVDVSGLPLVRDESYKDRRAWIVPDHIPPERISVHEQGTVSGISYDNASTGLLSTDLASAAKPPADITYESTEATLSRIRTQLDHAVSGDAVAAITGLADTLPAALPDDPETVGHVADGQTALADAQAALQRAVDAAQAALKSHEANNGPAHEAAQSAGGAPERGYVTDGLAGQIELAFNPAEPRGKGGEWVSVGSEIHRGIVTWPDDFDFLADERQPASVRGEKLLQHLTSQDGGLGMSWSGDRSHAEEAAEGQVTAGGVHAPPGYEYAEKLPVVLHAEYPDERDIETDHRALAEHDARMGGWEDEVPVKGLVKITGVSWAPEPRKWVHYKLPTPQQTETSNPSHLLTTDLAAWEHEPRGKGGRWYHATNADLKPGDIVKPAAQVGRKTRGGPGDENHVWVSNDPIRAGAYGSRIYEVSPAEVPKHTRGPADEHLTSAAKVVREVPYSEARELSPSYQAQAAAYAKTRRR